MTSADSPADDGAAGTTDATHRRPGGAPHGPTAAGDHDEHEHRSRWPLVAALGAGGLYAGVAIALLANAAGFASPAVGVVLGAGGALVLLVGVFGWLDEAFFGRLDAAGIGKPRESYVGTTLLFLATDVATFGAVFVYYFFVRVGAWPPGELPPLLSSLVLANTAVLVASSFTLHFAHEGLQEGRRRRSLALLATTLALGVVFLAGQAYEYYEFVVAEGFTLSDGVFASAFFGLTGLHGLHVTLGVGGLAILCWRALRGHYGPDRDTSVSTVSLYWHFVDVVWLFLVVVLYVGAAAT
ncbi:cytochrome c oxidase subunit 3 [Salinilacihabitans rarus]|uniref:cytochrome c oxidase subunit 3 n=1 Tax=Salinilacihabitans rarus TaxID=2961596 RepID=UPI0020C899CC|nr:heme-copper oxidase subunit III [Salinilacihabitans rarus]